MCVDHTMICTCGQNSASFHFKDEVMPHEVVGGLYCPHCFSGIAFNPENMMKDNGWVIEYDMEVARFMSQKLPRTDITPEYLFDEGYCTWRGVYPTDHRDSVREREELVQLARINPKKYLVEFRRWGIERMDRLSQEGWRKADAGR